MALALDPGAPYRSSLCVETSRKLNQWKSEEAWDIEVLSSPTPIPLSYLRGCIMKVAIIGAGIVGSTAAYYLSKEAQVDVTAYDHRVGQATKGSGWYH